jgi:hypothetical protein
MNAHVKLYGDAFRAMVLFGDIVTTEGTYDIDALEVVSDWQGGLLQTFTSNAILPLRGQLRLYFMTPEQFEDPTRITDEADQVWAYQLLDRIRRGYELIYERPVGYARDVLSGDNSIRWIAPPTSGSVAGLDPLHPSGQRG